MRLVVPEDGSGEPGVGEHGEDFGRVPVFGAGATAHDEDGLVGVVLVDGRVVVCGEVVAVGKLLNGGVVIADAETGGEAELPTNAGHAVSVEIREEFVGVIPGLVGIGAGGKRGGSDGLLLHGALEEEALPGGGLGYGRGGLYDAEADVAFLRRVRGSHAGAVGGASEVRCGCGNVEVGCGLGGGPAEVEATAANGFGVAGDGADWIDLFAGLIRGVPVEGPLGTANAHVLDAECVGRVGFWHLVRVAEDVFAPGAGGVFPLAFGR